MVEGVWAHPVIRDRWTTIAREHAVFLVIALAIAASVSGVRNGFALDDVHIIVGNGRVHSLANLWHLFGQTYWPPLEGASLYRPLTMLAFTIEWVTGSGSPLPFHLVSIALYAGVCVALYRLLTVIAESDVALVAAVLFAVHPVHTEVVANVVGQAELIVALFVLLAVERYVRARRAGKITPRDLAVISALYLGGCLAKEHAIILPGLLVACEVLIAPGRETAPVRMRRMAPTLAVLAVIAVGFVVVRTMVTGGLRAAGHNELFDNQPYAARVMTMLTIVVEWLRLLFWPSRLSADYSFPRTRVATEPDLAMVPGILVILGCTAIAWRLRRSNPVVTFSFLWIAATLAIPSNLIMVTGFVLAERALFLASVGIALIGAVAILYAWRTARGYGRAPRFGLIVATGALVALGIAGSSIRNPVWHDNESLFVQTVEDVPLSSRAHWMLAELLAKTGRHREGADEMTLAVALGRKDDSVLVAFGADQLQAAGMCGRAVPLYHRALALKPADVQLRTNATLCLIKVGRIREAKATAIAGIAKTGKSSELHRMVVLTDSLILSHAQASGTLPR